MDTKHTPTQLTSKFVAEVLNLPKSKSESFEFSAIITDSRKVTPGCLFVALQGENFDGRQFIESALSKGARGVLYSQGANVPSLSSRSDVFDYPVQDSLAAYRSLAQSWRQKFNLPVIVVAGSAGKTTTKELLAALVKGKWTQVLKTEGSQNGFVGIPMTLLDLRPHHQIAIVEVGIDEIGAMKKHLEIVAPTACILTAIGPEHLEKLIDLPTVAREEGIALSHTLEHGGFTALNLDDPWISKDLALKYPQLCIPFTLQAKTPQINSKINAVTGTLNSDHQSLQIQGTPRVAHPFTVKLPLLGKHNAQNLLGAISLALGLGLTPEEIQKGLQTFQGAEGRSQVKFLPGPLKVICDYYNAQPASVAAGLELLSDLARSSPSASPSPGQKWACLGDMLELGPQEAQFHRDLYRPLIDLKIDHVLLFGPRMKNLYEELKGCSFSGEVKHFDSHAHLASALTSGVRPGDTILIKGSRGMKMEEAWKLLESYAKSKWLQYDHQNFKSEP